MSKPLRIREKGNYLKVVDPYYETVCESFLDHKDYSPRAKHIVNEMVHSWNQFFGKGLDIATGLPVAMMSVTKRTNKTFLVEGKELPSLEQVEEYAKSVGKRVLLTQTALNSNIYLVTLTK